MKIWLITMTERTDGRTDGRWTVGGRTPGRKNPRIWPIYPDGLAGWLAKSPRSRKWLKTSYGARPQARAVNLSLTISIEIKVCELAGWLGWTQGWRTDEGGRTDGGRSDEIEEGMKI